MMNDYKATITGSVRPPADMMKAARDSLPPEEFDALMLETEGQAPTPAQLVAHVEAWRAKSQPT